MAFTRDANTTRTAGASARGYDVDLADGEWGEEERPGRDWKKLVLVFGLGVLSWVATYVGMLELIEANMGDLPLLHKAIIGFSVAMLMTMIIWLLDQIFAPIGFLQRLTFIAGYAFLTIISVGFGFGFYWKVLESRSESARSAESAVSQVQASLHAASTRMSQLSTTLDQLNQISLAKAELERTKGSSCPNSRPGDGPRRKLRDEDAQRFGFAAEFVKARVGTVKGDLSALDVDLGKIASDDKSTVDEKSGTRNEFMRALGRKLDMTVTGFNAFRTDPQLKQLRADLAERADRTVFPDSQKGTFTCPDAQLQQALKGVVRAIDQLPELEKPKIAAVEGSEATIEAFRRLTATFYGMLSFKMPPSADELRDLQKKAVQSVEASPSTQKALASADGAVGLSKRDYIPLAIALFVDLCLLLVSMSRPINRLHGLVPKMRAAERGPVIQILSRFNDIHRDDEIRKNFEVFRHVVFDFHGAYYVAVPLDAPYKPSGPYTKSYSTEDIQDLQLEAHLLANLFTSFEQEKIFTRVYSPLLTTRSIKKKLHRQGSKFAHAEAFRVYRFRDGAWSEIILGAVMGAARRVEAEKRKRRLEDQLFNAEVKPEPTLEAANDHTQPAQEPNTRTASAESRPAMDLDIGNAEPLGNVASMTGTAGRRGFFARRVAEAGGVRGPATPVLEASPPSTSSSTAPADEYGPYAARRAREMAEEDYRSTLPTLRGHDDILDRPRPRRRASGETPDRAGGDDIPAGEVVLFAIPGNGESGVATSATRAQEAASPSAEPARPAERETPRAELVISHVRQSPATSAQGTSQVTSQVSGPAVAGTTAEPRVGVILRRETAEFTLPASEATLPSALLAVAGLGSSVAETQSSVTAAPATFDLATLPSNVTSPPAPASVPAIPAPITTFSLLDETPGDEEDDTIPLFDEPEIDIEIDAISRRFRPTAAE
ncbi:MAG: hypothetical protein JNM89_17030 [Hyphomicrobiaceae bacterium]|nr:hypothetical protein [Hyphomicrobiaceae bacterium]